MWLFQGCVCVEMFKEAVAGSSLPVAFLPEAFMGIFGLALLMVPVQEFSLHVVNLQAALSLCPGH